MAGSLRGAGRPQLKKQRVVVVLNEPVVLNAWRQGQDGGLFAKPAA